MTHVNMYIYIFTCIYIYILFMYIHIFMCILDTHVDYIDRQTHRIPCVILSLRGHQLHGWTTRPSSDPTTE